MKPDWDKLMADFADSKSSLVADVDCTADGKSLCEKQSVSGYPTIKYGEPTDLKDYQGGRKYDDLKKFAEENLGPSCGPDNLDLCKDDDKALLEKLMKMDLAELNKEIEDVDGKVKKIEDKNKNALDKLLAKMDGINKDIEKKKKENDDKVKKEKKKVGLGVMKAVAASRKKEDL